jgi:phosphopantothenoylcysteine decarboxylase/phosphopantothenate--cysteine ligase
MGYAIAKAARNLGAHVTLISGPVNLKRLNGVNTVNVKSADDMAFHMKAHFPDCDYIVMAAAVADFTPEHVADEKIKKVDNQNTINLKKTEDILAYLGKQKVNQKICGFAMETQNVLENAKWKFEEKNCDLLVVNDLKIEGAGFQGDTNKVTLIKKDSNQELELMSKDELAYKILEELQKV